MAKTKSNIDYDALLAEAKALNAKIQDAKDHYVHLYTKYHYSCLNKKVEKVRSKIDALEKEYKEWKKKNIAKHGLILKVAGDKDEPICILSVLAGNYEVPMKLDNGRIVVR